MPFSPLITEEDIDQQYELEKLLRPARFAEWRVSRRSIANEMLRAEFGRDLDLEPPIPIRETPIADRPRLSPLDAMIAKETAVRAHAVASLLPPIMRSRFDRLMRGDRVRDAALIGLGKILRKLLKEN